MTTSQYYFSIVVIVITIQMCLATLIDINGPYNFSNTAKKVRKNPQCTTFCYLGANSIRKMMFTRRKFLCNTLIQKGYSFRSRDSFLNVKKNNDALSPPNNQKQNIIVQHDENILHKCTELMMADFKSLPSKKQKKANESNNTDHQSTKVLESRLRMSLESSPALFQIYCDYYDQFKKGQTNIEAKQKLPFNQMISKVGPYYKSTFLQMIVKHPSLLSTALKSNKLKTKDDQLVKSLGFTQNQFVVFKRDAPKDVMRRLHRANIIHLSNYLQDRFNFSKMDIQTMVVSRPNILAYTVHTLNITVEFLHKELGLPMDTISAMIKRNPMILAYSPSKIQPLVEFLRDDIGNTDWQRIIAKNAQLFSYSIEKNLRPKSQFLYEFLCLQRMSDLSLVVSSFTPVLWLSNDLLSSKINFFRDEFNLDEEEMRVIFLTYPQLLGLSIDKNVRPKISFFLSSVTDKSESDDCDGNKEENGAGLSREELKYLIMYQPAVLAYSLEKRIKPRIRKMQQHFILYRYAPHYIMSLPDAKFEKWLETQRGTWSIM